MSNTRILLETLEDRIAYIFWFTRSAIKKTEFEYGQVEEYAMQNPSSRSAKIVAELAPLRKF